MRFPAYPNQGRTVREYPLDEYADFIEGAAVVLVAGEIAECGTDPATITGFALFDSGNLPLEDKMSVSVARAKSTFIMQGNVPPVQSDEGKEYGITRDADGVWHVDKTKTGGSARLLVERVFVGDSRDQYEVSVLATNRQFDG